MPKNKKSPASLSELYNEVSRRADTDALQISVADTKRVLACFFDVLAERPPGVAFRLIAKGLKRAEKRR